MLRLNTFDNETRGARGAQVVGISEAMENLKTKPKNGSSPSTPSAISSSAASPHYKSFSSSIQTPSLVTSSLHTDAVGGGGGFMAPSPAPPSTDPFTAAAMRMLPPSSPPPTDELPSEAVDPWSGWGVGGGGGGGGESPSGSNRNSSDQPTSPTRKMFQNMTMNFGFGK